MRRRGRAVGRLGSCLVPLAGLGWMAIAGCDGAPKEDELQALLHDEPMTSVGIAALTASDGGVIGGSGGVSGTGIAGAPGKAGAGPAPMGIGGGAPFDGGTSPTGVAGAGFGGGFGSTGVAGTGFGGTNPPGTGVGGKFETGSGGFGGGGPVEPGLFGPLGQWTFNDCNSFRTELFDSGPNNVTAFRAVTVTCAEGMDGPAVALADNDDIVYVPDQPFFSSASGVTVAGWFNPTQVNKTRTLFRKRDDGSSSAFALVLNDQKYQFVINLGNGRAASVVAPKKAKAGVWTHVGATYDGITLRLYIDGKEVEHNRAKGTIAAAAGPFLMGNDGSKRLYAGALDSALYDDRALSADEMLALTCIRRPASIAGTPARSAPTATGAMAPFDIAITNNDSPSCTPSDLFFQASPDTFGVNVEPSFQVINGLAAGTTSHLTMTASGSDDLDTGVYPIQIFAFSNFGYYSFSQGTVELDFVASGCRVSKPRELMITSLSVVDDPVRTVGDGAWTFKHLVEAMAPTPADAPAMVEAALATFDETQTVNGFEMPARPGMKRLILDGWQRTAEGALDLAQAPVTLQAIVDRFDLRNLDNGDAGEGRFVFAFHFPGSSFPLQATIILEYKLPATTEDDVLAWANAWHALGSLPFPSESYNAALQAITERFAGRGARPAHVNGSAINAVRTNEIDFGGNGLWELREFVLSPTTGRLVPGTIKLTPALSFNFSSTLASFVNANEAAIIAETHDVPEQFEGAPFLTGAVLNDGFTRWQASGITNPEARFHFGLNTCNGCHSSEVNVRFLQITPRFPGSEAGLSAFLQGTQVFDPNTGGFRTINDLGRRQTDLRAIVCANEPPPSGGGGAGGMGGGPTMTGVGGRGTPPPTGAAGAKGFSAPAASTTTSLRRGIARVH